MRLDSQVCLLELSKRLKELGVKQDSLFYWIPPVNTNYKVYSVEIIGCFNKNYHNHCMSAFTASELGEILPNRILIPNSEPFDNYVININKFFNVNEDRSLTNNYIVNYSCDSTAAGGVDAWMVRKMTKNIFDSNLANAMAKMLIYLIENKLITTQS